MAEKVKCPLCGHIFDSEETFAWDLDENEWPTIESIYCPACYIGTTPRFNCNMCPGSVKNTSHTCTLEDACAACLSFSFEDFKTVG